MPSISEIQEKFREAGYRWGECGMSPSCVYLSSPHIHKFFHGTNLEECWQKAWTQLSSELNQFQGDEEEACFV